MKASGKDIVVDITGRNSVYKLFRDKTPDSIIDHFCKRWGVAKLAIKNCGMNKLRVLGDRIAVYRDREGVHVSVRTAKAKKYASTRIRPAKRTRATAIKYGSTEALCMSAELSSSAYKDQPFVDLKKYPLLLKDHWKQSMWRGHRASAYMVTHEGSGIAYLTFKGTDSYTDIIMNALAMPGARVPHTQHCWMHYGFTKGVTSLERKINQVLDREGITKVVVLGHSLGGAMAGVYALRNRERVSKVVTFGAPFFMWVAAEDRCDAYREWPYSLNMTHYVYKNDPVPRILGTNLTDELINHYVGNGYAGQKLGKWLNYYTPVGEAVFLDDGGKHSMHSEQSISYDEAMNSLKDHSMSNYVRVLCN